MQCRSSRWKMLCSILLTFAIALICCSCGESDRMMTISAKSLFSGKYASIKVLAHDILPGALESNGYVTFKSNESMDEIYDLLKDDSFTDVAKYDNAILITDKSGEKTDYFCLSKSGQRYVFGGMCGNVIIDVTKDSGRVTKWILLPVHFISDELILNGNNPKYTLYANVDYKLNCSKHDIQRFYQDCSWYNVSFTDDRISITGFSDVIDSMPDALNYEKLAYDVPFVIELTETNEGLYFSILSESIIASDVE